MRHRRLNEHRLRLRYAALLCASIAEWNCRAPHVPSRDGDVFASEGKADIPSLSAWLRLLASRLGHAGAVANTNKTTRMLIDQLAALDPARRRELAAALRTVAETVADVRDGKTASHVVGVLAHLLDPV